MTVTGSRHKRAIAPALFVIVVSLAACASTDPGVSAPAVATPSAASPEPSLAVVPTTFSPSPPRPIQDPSLEPPMPQPPAASIAVEGGDPVEGQLGTFTWQNSGSDSPWLDGSPIRVGSGEQLTLMLDDPVEIDTWTVSRVQPGNRDGIGAVRMAEALHGPVIFDAPPAGIWSVEVSVRFADELGTALYFWQIAVD
jgi:hypothetical protein